MKMGKRKSRIGRLPRHFEKKRQELGKNLPGRPKKKKLRSDVSIVSSV